MPDPAVIHSQPSSSSDANLARDHLANERTFLAWIRTGVAIVVFGFAIGRFAIAIRQWMEVEGQGRVIASQGVSVWLGTVAIFAGVGVCLAGLARYRRTRDQLNAGRFEPAGFVIDLVAIVTVLFGLALAAYLVYFALHF
ncbi:MAG: DUF202 domain-containing protein [Candidatus Acidiferrum sp.]|jgi:putative membrane protein